jgi:hypothetical protein
MRTPKSLPSKLLSPQVEAIAGTFLGLAQKYAARREPVELEKIIRIHPVVAAAAEIRTVLLPLLMMGDYVNSNESIQSEVRAEIAALEGSWKAHIAKMNGYQSYGFAVIEKEYKVTITGCGLSRLRVLNQQFVSFDGDNEIEKVIYSPPRRKAFGDKKKGKNQNKVELDYDRVIHLINGDPFTLGNDPKGIALLDRVAPYYDAFNLMMATLILAAKRQATPMLYGKTNTRAQQPILGNDGLPVIDPRTGQPLLVSASEKFKNDLEQVENGSVMVIDLQDELAAIAATAKPELILEGAQFIMQMIMMCFLVPQTTIGMSSTGVGDSGLSEQHQQLLLMLVKADIHRISEAIIECLIRPMLDWNHGQLDDYGRFPVIEAKDNAETIALLGVIPNLVSSGVLTASDKTVISKVKESIGV